MLESRPEDALVFTAVTVLTVLTVLTAVTVLTAREIISHEKFGEIFLHYFTFHFIFGRLPPYCELDGVSTVSIVSTVLQVLQYFKYSQCLKFYKFYSASSGRLSSIFW